MFWLLHINSNPHRNKRKEQTQINFLFCLDAKELEKIRKVLSFDHHGEEHKTHSLSSASSVATVTGDTDQGGEGGGDGSKVEGESEGSRENGAVKGHIVPEIKRMDLHNFVFIKVLGKGSFGKVSVTYRLYAATYHSLETKK